MRYSGHRLDAFVCCGALLAIIVLISGGITVWLDHEDEYVERRGELLLRVRSDTLEDYAAARELVDRYVTRGRADQDLVADLRDLLQEAVAAQTACFEAAHDGPSGPAAELRACCLAAGRQFARIAKLVREHGIDALQPDLMAHIAFMTDPIGNAVIMDQSFIPFFPAYEALSEMQLDPIALEKALAESANRTEEAFLRRLRRNPIGGESE